MTLLRRSAEYVYAYEGKRAVAKFVGCGICAGKVRFELRKGFRISPGETSRLLQLLDHRGEYTAVGDFMKAAELEFGERGMSCHSGHSRPRKRGLAGVQKTRWDGHVLWREESRRQTGPRMRRGSEAGISVYVRRSRGVSR
jgi:hypothetical protein